MSKAPEKSAYDGDRIAKVLARAGVGPRREAERYIADGRVAVDGRKLLTPAFNVTPAQIVTLDGTPIAAPEPPPCGGITNQPG